MFYGYAHEWSSDSNHIVIFKSIMSIAQSNMSSKTVACVNKCNNCKHISHTLTSAMQSLRGVSEKFIKSVFISFISQYLLLTSNSRVFIKTDAFSKLLLLLPLLLGNRVKGCSVVIYFIVFIYLFIYF